MPKHYSPDKIPSEVDRALIQALADGKTMKEVAWAKNGSVHTLYSRLKELRYHHKATGVPMLVAIFMRKGWIT